MNIIIGILGFLLGILFWYFFTKSNDESNQRQIEFFRQEWIKTHSESVEHFSNEMILRALIKDVFNLINADYTFRRHSPIWKTFKGIEIHKRIKDFIEGNKPEQELKGFPVEIVTLQSVKDLSLALRMVENYPISWKGYELTLERLKIIHNKLLIILAANNEKSKKLS